MAQETKPQRRVRHQTVAVSENQLTIANGIASSARLSRHAVLALALRHGIAAISHLSQSELWAMMPRNVASRLRRLSMQPTDRTALRERIRQRKIAKAYEDTEEG